MTDLPRKNSDEDFHYNVALNDGEFKFTEKASKFLSICTRTDTEESALEFLSERSKAFHDASHHCWALRVGDPANPVERYSDAGEPSGTAGRPILDQIRKADLIGVIVIVTRWFGGTKLGKGGLVRAYGGGAAGAIANVKTQQLRPMSTLHIPCGYDQIGLVEKLTAQSEGKVINGDYGVTVTLRVELPAIRADQLIDTLFDSSSGTIQAEVE